MTNVNYDQGCLPPVRDAAVIVFDQLLVLQGIFSVAPSITASRARGLMVPHSLFGLVDLLGEVGVGLAGLGDGRVLRGVLGVVRLDGCPWLFAGRVVGRAWVAGRASGRASGLVVGGLLLGLFDHVVDVDHDPLLDLLGDLAGVVVEGEALAANGPCGRRRG